MKAGILVVALALLGAGLWFAGFLTPAASHIQITHALLQPGMGGQVNAVLTIENQGAPDELIAVASPDGDVALRNAEIGLPIITGVSSLAMDAAHIRVTPAEPLEDGALFPLALTFAQAGEVQIRALYASPEPGSMAAHAAMGHTMMHEPAADEATPTLALQTRPTETGWIAEIAVEHFIFSEELQDGDHVPGHGHGHIYVGGMKLGRVFSDSFAIGPLPPGTHTVRVTLNTNDHRAYAVEGEAIEALATIAVD